MSSRPSGIVIEFLGATETVTGSRFLLSTPRARVLIDCGLYQGLKTLRERNWKPSAIAPGSLDAIVLTHAHVDHSGYLPRMAREGFRGPIFATHRTVELCGIVLPDSGHLQEEEARFASAAGFSKHADPQPLYTRDDAVASLKQLRGVAYDTPIEVADGVRATFLPAGHILGSATITIEVDGVDKPVAVFSGDLGRADHPLLEPPAAPVAAHNILIESTYGDRAHEQIDAQGNLGRAINATVERGGVAVIPAFAVDRTEVVLYYLKCLIDAGEIDPLPVYVDSPMALASLGVYRQAIADGDPEIRPSLRGTPDVFRPDGLTEAKTVEASKAIHDVAGPALIISASGMATGGRVLHHLARRLHDARNSVIFVGFQAAGTRGRLLIDGHRELKLMGRYVPVRAEVVDLSSFSVHADRTELLDWLRASPSEPDAVYVIHGEPRGSAALCEQIETELGWCGVVPRYRERVLAV
jgi:metallo-beta-lactamase family protein